MKNHDITPQKSRLLSPIAGLICSTIVVLSTAHLKMDSIAIAMNKKIYWRHGSIVLLLTANKNKDSTEANDCVNITTID